MAAKKIPPVHPGEVLLEEFLVPLGISQYRLAKATGIPQTRVSQIVKHRRAVTADTALRLGRFFRTSPEFWMNLQALYDLEIARDAVGGRIEKKVVPYAA
jgi:addiction module HigA family antidote